LHVVTGGTGSPLMLLEGWPQFWWQWRKIMPRLAADFSVVVIDPRGLDASDKPETGYDTRTAAADLLGVMDQLGYRRFSVVGRDVGMWRPTRWLSMRPNAFRGWCSWRPAFRAYSPTQRAARRQPRNRATVALHVQPAAGGRRTARRRPRRDLLREPVRGESCHSDRYSGASVEVYLRAPRQPGALHAAFHYYRVLPGPRGDTQAKSGTGAA